MTTATPQQTEIHMIDIAQIRADQNVREQLNPAEVDALASSIALLGQLTPVSVRPDTERDGFVLIAGHKRLQALKHLGHEQIRAEVRRDAGQAPPSGRPRTSFALR